MTFVGAGLLANTMCQPMIVVAKRMISAEQRNDPQRLKRLVQSVQFGIAIEQGHSAMEILAVMTDGDSHQVLQRPPVSRPPLNAGF